MLADDDPCVRAAVVNGVGGGSLGKATLTLAAEKVLDRTDWLFGTPRTVRL